MDLKSVQDGDTYLDPRTGRVFTYMNGGWVLLTQDGDMYQVEFTSFQPPPDILEII
jgi:hypothetical protein